jgi:hypothetical protein
MKDEITTNRNCMKPLSGSFLTASSFLSRRKPLSEVDTASPEIGLPGDRALTLGPPVKLTLKQLTSQFPRTSTLNHALNPVPFTPDIVSNHHPSLGHRGYSKHQPLKLGHEFRSETGGAGFVDVAYFKKLIREGGMILYPHPRKRSMSCECETGVTRPASISLSLLSARSRAAASSRSKLRE